MNKAEAFGVVAIELAKFKAKSYDELKSIIDFSDSKEHELENGKYYQTQTQVFWDNPKEKKNIRVYCAIDDGGWRAFFPIVTAFIISPNGVIDD